MYNIFMYTHMHILLEWLRITLKNGSALYIKPIQIPGDRSPHLV